MKLEELSEDEQAIYNKAFERFTKGETYKELSWNQGLQEKLQREFAEHCTMSFKKHNRRR